MSDDEMAREVAEEGEVDEEKSTYVTAAGTELEVTYYNESSDPPLPYITNEVRYRMKNIPFFLLPPCESKAYDPSQVKAKVDTRNTNYVPPQRPWSSDGSNRASSSPPKPRWNTSSLSRSFTDSSSSMVSPRYTKSGPSMRQTGQSKKEAGDGMTESTAVATSTPRRDSGGSSENIKSGSVTRKKSMPDYSHVKSKISTCWGKDGGVKEVGMASEKSSNQDLSSNDSSPASIRRSREGVKGATKKRVGSGGRCTDYSHVTARVDSNRNCRMVTASGGVVDARVAKKDKGRDGAELTDGKLASPKSPRRLHLDGSGQRGGKVDQSSGLKSPPANRRIDIGLARDTTTAKPGGLSKQISPMGAQKSPTRKILASYTVNSPRNRYANVKAKVDTSDPNPAHKLTRTISDLTIKEGKQINPRFANVRPERTTGARSSNIPGPAASKDRQSYSRTKGERASGIKSPFTKERPTSELVSKGKMPSMRRGMDNQNSALKKREIHSPTAQKIAAQSADILREDEVEDYGAVIDKEVWNQPLISQAFTEEPSVTVKEEENESLETGTGICGIEVTNNEMETTVVLKHILALGRGNEDSLSQSSSPISNDLAIVEEDELEEDEVKEEEVKEEEEFYESKDKVKTPSEIPSSYILPNLIPKLIVTTEDEELVETVVTEARQLESAGKDLTGYSTGQKHAFSSSKLGAFDEDEEEEDSLSTHL